MKRTIAFIMVSFFVLLFSTLGFAYDNSLGEPSVGDIVGDVLWIRPLGFIGTAFEAIAFVVSLPVTIPLKKTNEAKEFLIEDSHHFYFKRPLGEM